LEKYRWYNQTQNYNLNKPPIVTISLEYYVVRWGDIHVLLYVLTQLINQRYSKRNILGGFHITSGNKGQRKSVLTRVKETNKSLIDIDSIDSVFFFVRRNEDILPSFRSNKSKLLENYP
jgi:hypothetical protein